MDTGNFHESEERLELYMMHRLPESEIQVVEEHLLMCDPCRERLDQAEVFAVHMREALQSQPLTTSAPGWFSAGWFGWLKPQFAMAGAFAAVLLAVGIYATMGSVRVAPVASLQLTAMRGSEIQTVSPARELDLSFTDAPAPSRVDIVDASGASVWTGTLTPHAGRVETKVGQVLSPGNYFARVSGPSGQVLHEYGFRVVK